MWFLSRIPWIESLIRMSSNIINSCFVLEISLDISNYQQNWVHLLLLPTIHHKVYKPQELLSILHSWDLSWSQQVHFHLFTTTVLKHNGLNKEKDDLGATDLSCIWLTFVIFEWCSTKRLQQLTGWLGEHRWRTASISHMQHNFVDRSIKTVFFKLGLNSVHFEKNMMKRITGVITACLQSN